jgi:hypothetical protein
MQNKEYPFYVGSSIAANISSLDKIRLCVLSYFPFGGLKALFLFYKNTYANLQLLISK